MSYSYRENEERYWNAMRTLQKTMGFDGDSNVADDILDLVARIERLRELHKPKQLSIVWTGCEICWEHPNTRGTSYPCPTIKALDGEE